MFFRNPGRPIVGSPAPRPRRRFGRRLGWIFVDLCHLEVTPLPMTTIAAAEQLRDEILQILDDVYFRVFDGPDMSDEQVELLALLPTGDLKLIASWAEEYAENVRDFARLAREALEAKD